MKKNITISARSGAVELLTQVLVEGAYTNIAMNKYLRNHKFNDLDRRFLTELVYGTIKALGTIDWYLSHCLNRPLSKLEVPIVQLLRISVYQIVYMDRVPNSAACNEAVNLAKCYSNEGAAKFVNGVLRGLIRKLGEIKFPDEAEDDLGYLSLKYYHPKWMLKRWLGVFGREGTERLCQFDNAPASLCLRTNTLVMSRAQLLNKLQEAGAVVTPSDWCREGLICEKMPALGGVFAKLSNAFYVQDESSMVIGGAMNPQPGERILDLCSAPGGKATHLAQLMENKGEVIACDIHEHKLKLIEENAKRLGLFNILAKLHDATVFTPEWEEGFDRVLVDAPCSGLGVLRRRAEARWRKKKQELAQFPVLQLKILENAARYVKKDGVLVYSTCTIEFSENHYLVQEFLKQHKEFRFAGFRHPITGKLVEELQLLPQEDGVDGFYIAVLKKD